MPAHIDIICPSRGRPARFAAMLDSLQQTAATPDWTIWTRLDDDDPTACDYPQHARVRYVRGPRKPLSMLGNELCTYGQGDIIAAGSDDLRCHTEGWDERIRSARPADDIYVLYPDDMFNHHPTIMIISRLWFKTVGYYAPPQIQHWYGDNWLASLGARCNRLMRVDVIWEHLHPFIGKAATDATYDYQQRQGGAVIAADRKAFLDGESERKATVARLKALMRE